MSSTIYLQCSHPHVLQGLWPCLRENDIMQYGSQELRLVNAGEHVSDQKVQKVCKWVIISQNVLIF